MRLRNCTLLAIALFPIAAAAQVPTIVNEIGQLEGVRDPKCYATASRLEDFIYGTPLESPARFEKIARQKALIRALWLQASGSASAAGMSTIDAETLRLILQASVPSVQATDGSWMVFPADDTRRTNITARDKRQYGTVAYALRAILSVQQDALIDGTKLLPLDPPAVELLKETIDLITLAALQRADRDTRLANREQISSATLKTAWNALVKTSPAPVVPAKEALPTGEKFATIRAIVAEKLQAYEKYNDLSQAVFLRNVQVYMARHMWPSDPVEGKAFRDQFTETMVAWTSDVMLDADRRARRAGHPLIRVEDVHDAVQAFEPHELNQYEDCIYFPRLPKSDQIVIEAYDLDSFRDPGLHWFYLSETLKDPSYKGTLEPDPFAAELLTEGGAQMGTLILRVAGQFAGEEGLDRLNHTHLTKAVTKIQALLDRSAALPPVAPVAKVSHPIASAPSPKAGSKSDAKYFTDITSASGIQFDHRLSDWLSRFIRSYTITEGNTVRLAVPPTFGGSGIAAEDIDNDGDIDVLILSGAGNALYLNDGKGHFTNVTEAAGLAWKRPDGHPGEPRQPIIADFDNDGLEDILITYADDDHRMYRNLGHARFEDVTARCALGGKGLVGGPATAFDFDRDGLLDLYIGYFGDYIHGELPTLARRNNNGLPNRLFRNKGNFVFEDVTAGSGVDNRGWAQAVGHLDFDGDGWEDLICGNDFGTNAWYRNLGNGKFEDVSAKIGTDKPSYTMSIGITDLNRDGYPDVYISNIVTMDKDEKYVLPDTKTRMKFNPAKMANMRVVEANDLFTSVAQKGSPVTWEQSNAVGRGYRSTGWSWGANFFDFDNDGDDDLYVLNGMNEYAVYSSVNPYFADPSGVQRNAIMPVAEKEAPVFFTNRDGYLLEESAKSGANLPGNARSAVYFDLDGDGDLDMVVNNFEAPAAVYRNNTGSNGNHWIRLRLVGDPKKGVTADAIGARIIVDTEHEKGMWREVFSTVGYLTSNPKEQEVGLGADRKADVTIAWPNGDRETFRGLAADVSYRIVQGEKPSPQRH